MKKTVLCIFLFLAAGFVSADDCNCGSTQKMEQVWSFEFLHDLILEIFPEAYPEFLTISFSSVFNDGDVYPVEATFLIPSRLFDTTLTPKEMQKRMALIMHALGQNSFGCETIDAGPPQNYSYQSWQDRTVRKVTLRFNIGC